MADLASLQVFTLIFVRMTAFFVSLPFPGYKGVPNLVKFFLALVSAYLIFLSGAFSYRELPLSAPGYIMFAAGEALAGLAVGFLVLLIFSAFRIVGQIMDIKLGLGMASVFDPQHGTSSTLLAQFFYFFALVLYLTLNGHHQLLVALARSYEFIPIGGVAISDTTVQLVLKLFYETFSMAFQIAAPIVVVIIITDISLGLISKTVPQLQVFIVGLPLKIGLGLLAVYLLLPHISPLLEDIFNGIYDNLLRIMGSLT
jgi:flagellar biosynthesis protein FliR